MRNGLRDPSKGINYRHNEEKRPYTDYTTCFEVFHRRLKVALKMKLLLAPLPRFFASEVYPRYDVLLFGPPSPPRYLLAWLSQPSRPLERGVGRGIKSVGW